MLIRLNSRINFLCVVPIKAVSLLVIDASGSQIPVLTLPQQNHFPDLENSSASSELPNKLWKDDPSAEYSTEKTSLYSSRSVSKINLKQMDDGGIICVGSVDGSLIAPNLSISIGDSDVTELFTLSVTPKVDNVLNNI